MARAHARKRNGRKSGIRAAAALLTLGIMMALTAGPALSSGREGGESHQHHGEGKSGSKFYGTVQMMPKDRVGTWVVDGREILVTKDTRIEEEYGAAVDGAYVEVEGDNTGKVFTAYKVEVKRARK